MTLTQEILDQLGFSEYWGEAGDFGNRRLQLVDTRILVYVIDELEAGFYDPSDPHSPEHVVDANFQPLDTLEDLQRYITATATPADVEAFEKLTLNLMSKTN